MMKKILAFMLIGLLSLGFFVTNVQSQAVPGLPLVLTENSSTDLTATLNGAPIGVVTNESFPNGWAWTPPTPIGVTISDISILYPHGANLYGWQEPESNPSDPTYNLIPYTTLPFTSVGILSDFDGTEFGGPPLIISSVANGTQIDNFLTVNFSDGTNVIYDVTFVDNGDAAAVPEPATMLLLGSGLLGLWGARKKFKK